ncbi:MAG: DUF2934 domain-containing protein [Proteobacteria bacterium]|nr:DUF2934 domain-containing protein [Pseudomonadota bacterium]
MSARARLSVPTSTKPGVSGKQACPTGKVPDDNARRSLVVDGAERERMIREAAYFHAQHRAFAPGSELQDWLTAEREIDGVLAQSVALPSVAGPATHSEHP